MSHDYSGILLCSDYDGTLSYGGVCQQNLDALEYFMAHGGRFTLATGRGSYELKNGALPIKPNAPLILMVGAQIYDADSRHILREALLSPACLPTVRRILDHFAPLLDHVLLYCRDRTVSFSTTQEANDVLARFAGEEVFKIVFCLRRDFLPEEFAAAQAMAQPGYHVCTNCTDNFEITACGVHKGSAVLWLKDYIGADTLVCAGDQNGDVPMLRCADIGYATANAVQEAKDAADRVTIHAADGAIARIIEDLGNR